MIRIDKTIEITDEQYMAIKNLTTATRYEALDAVANILGLRTAQKATWSSSRKTIIYDANTIADITYRKGKVVSLEFYDKSGNPDVCISYNTYYFK
jgi:nitric oxide synthase oxygenase domain/subunit